jgi:hypothetical protein
MFSPVVWKRKKVFFWVEKKRKKGNGWCWCRASGSLWSGKIKIKEKMGGGGAQIAADSWCRTHLLQTTALSRQGNNSTELGPFPVRKAKRASLTVCARAAGLVSCARWEKAIRRAQAPSHEGPSPRAGPAWMGLSAHNPLCATAVGKICLQVLKIFSRLGEDRT